MRTKITKRAVEGVTPGERPELLWDTEVPGFGAKITPRGARVYVLQYRHGGRVRRYTMGRHGGELTAHEARQEAIRLRGLVAAGHDPAGERSAVRALPTLTEIADRYLLEHAAVKKKASSAAEDRRNLCNHILPALGTRKINDITRADVSRLHGAMRDRPGAANRCLALLSKMFNLAENWGLRPDQTNPTRHVEKYPERKRARFLSEEELARLGTVLGEAARAGEHPSVIAALRLLILTGCRRNEILTLKWEHVDLKRGCLRLPDSKSGAKVIPLGAPAIELLEGLPRKEGNPYVLPGLIPGKHYVGLARPWRRLRARAGLGDVRLHDLRHSFASVGAGLGESLLMIGSLLGHKTPATTARYAHLSNDPQKASADRISGRIAAVLRNDSGKVVNLNTARN